MDDTLRKQHRELFGMVQYYSDMGHYKAIRSIIEFALILDLDINLLYCIKMLTETIQDEPDIYYQRQRLVHRIHQKNNLQ